MSILLILLLVAAVICFACAAVGVVSKFNLTAAGLFFWALTQLLPLLLRLGCVALACALLAACSTAQLKQDEKAIKRTLSSTNFSFGASFDGVTLNGSRNNGQNSVGLNVDPKQVVEAIER